MRKLLIAAVLLLAVSVHAADPVEEVRQAEIAFAKAFADRDQAKFFSFVLHDAHFVGGRTQTGKKEVVDRWSRFFTTPEAPFSWGPALVYTNAAGTIGLSTGPVYSPKGEHTGNYSSVWVKQPDGAWKILFDGPGSQSACLVADAAATEEGFVTADDGVKLHYRKVGNGPALVVPLEALMFDDFKQLADVATVISYDLRNRGRSQRLTDLSSVTVQQDVKDLEAVRAHFKLEKFVPVGFSYLGKMVAMYAAQHPEHVARMIQLGPVQMDMRTTLPKTLTHGRDDVPATAEQLEKQKTTTEGKPACEADFAVASLSLVGNPAHADRIHNWCDLESEWPQNLGKHFAALWPSIQSTIVTKEDAAKITMPVLTIHGTFDRNAPYGSGREWAMSLPNARLVTIPGAGHVSWADDPVNVFGSIRAFLRGEWPLGAEKVTSLNP